ncbi:MAG: CpaF family protein [Polyangiaceae bacterium]|nr:CpaF family protein [Polyangiaceae bacterium]
MLFIRDLSSQGTEILSSDVADGHTAPQPVWLRNETWSHRATGLKSLKLRLAQQELSLSILTLESLPVVEKSRMMVELVEELERSESNIEEMRNDPSQGSLLRVRVEEAFQRLIGRQGKELGPLAHDVLLRELRDQVLGLGPLEDLLRDKSISEILVLDHQTIYVERRGCLEECSREFFSEQSLRATIERMISPLGRRIDESSPMVDGRLPDGSRVNAVIPPLALRGPCLTIRKFLSERLSLKELAAAGALSPSMLHLLSVAVRERKNIVISGGTGSGKTTLLNALSGIIRESERIVTIEDAAELQLQQKHVVGLEAKVANLEGKGAIGIRELLRNALRMRPDRVIVGECRGGEALDMLQAMNTGHDGSMTTTHANSPWEALTRLETLCLMAGIDLPLQALRTQIGSAVDMIVQQSRLADGRRLISSIAELVGLDEQGHYVVRELYRFEPGAQGAEFRATGYLPSFELEAMSQTGENQAPGEEVEGSS